jgi:leucyl-tRNA synthetase
LLDALDGLDDWPAKVKLMQANWIGKSAGLQFAFGLTEPTTGHDRLRSTPPGPTRSGRVVHRHLARPSAGQELEAHDPEGRRLLRAECRGRHHRGGDREGGEAGLRHRPDLPPPVRHDWELPVWVANFILMDYGTGAIFGCPAHDQRDLDFARKYGLTWCRPSSPHRRPRETRGWRRGLRAAEDGEGALDASLPLGDRGNGDRGHRRRDRFCEGKGVGHGVTKFRLRDWGLSRQRYWGCPIPVVHCETCGVVPEKKENLPVELPDDVSFDVPGNPLDRHPTWRRPPARNAASRALRETDTMDTFVDSSWYFARFTAPHAATPTDMDEAGLLDECRPVYRRHRARDPAPALFPVLRPRDAHHRPPARKLRRTVRRAVHPRDGDARDLHHPR